MGANSVGQQCLHTLVERQAEKTPNAPALSFEGRRMSYGELNRRANQLAHHLRKLGVARETRVGLCFERSMEMIVSMLGILKAGGSYVPMDPAYPEERLRFVLEDSSARVLLSQHHLLPNLGADLPRTVSLDADWRTIAKESSEAPASNVRSQDVAYAIYTSGSTGKPKGVEIEHRGVCHLVGDLQRTFGFDNRDVWTLFHSCAFDFSVWEIWGCLVSGGTLVIVPRATTQSPGTFLELLRDENVTILNQTPTALRQLLQARRRAANGQRDLSVRLVICGGEMLPQELAAQMSDWDVPFWNFYGPTEATVWAICGAVNSCDVRSRTVPIGRPIGGYEIHLLDADLKPVPAGSPGELHIGGIGLARGYLDRPELTAEKFIPDPFSNCSGARLYKTGDLARCLPDGSIESLGRIDEQLKIRGFRIEPGEIESVIKEHPSVEQSAVIPREDSSGNQRLVAYVIPRAGHEAPAAGELFSFLRRKLPDYMVPSSFVRLDSLPRTPNGKVNRRALSGLDAVAIPVEGLLIPPRDEVEHQIAEIWEKALKLDSVGVTESFFELGGDSLLAMNVFLEIEELWGRMLPLATLLEAPTIELLARILQDDRWCASWESLVPLRSQGSNPPLFCVHPVGGSVLGFTDLARSMGSTWPVYGLRSQGFDGEMSPLRRVEEMAAKYIEEIREVRSHGPYYLSGLCFGAMVAFEMAQQLQASGEKIGLLCMLDPDGPGMPAPLQRLQMHLEQARRFGLRSYLGERAMAVRARWEKLKAKIHVGASSHLARTPTIHRNVEFANYEAIDAYVAKPYPGKITMIRAAERLTAADSWQLKWGDFARGGLDVCDVPGNHITMMLPPHVGRTAETLRDCLRRAD